jgi:hypothetical protein
MSYFEQTSGGQLVMLCQVCKTKHHDEPKKVFIHEKDSDSYREGVCRLCVCHDCIQLADDPVRKKLAPLIMGQTLGTDYRINTTKDGKEVTLEHKGPGLFSLEKAIKESGVLKLMPVDPPRHALPRASACGCGAEPRFRCVKCDEALCLKCQNTHVCQGSGKSF